jgi:hypothetical protein
MFEPTRLNRPGNVRGRSIATLDQEQSRRLDQNQKGAG